MNMLVPYYGTNVTLEQQDRLDAIGDGIKQAGKEIVYQNWEIGKMLTEAKRLIGHGKYIKWVEEKTGMNMRMAQYRIQMYAHIGPEFKDAYNKLDFKTIVALSSNTLPEENRQQLVKRIEAGERITKEEVKMQQMRTHDVERNQRRMMESIAPVARRLIEKETTSKMPKDLRILVEEQYTHLIANREVYDAAIIFAGNNAREVCENSVFLFNAMKATSNVFVITFPALVGYVCNAFASAGFEYYWQIVSQYQNYTAEAEFMSMYQPVLWYRKGGYDKHPTLPDLIQSDVTQQTVDMGLNETIYALTLLDGIPGQKNVLVLGAESGNLPSAVLKAGHIANAVVNSKQKQESIYEDF